MTGSIYNRFEKNRPFEAKIIKLIMISMIIGGLINILFVEGPVNFFAHFVRTGMFG